MRKIRSLFARDAEGVLTREYNTGVEWVFHEGVATRKWDGTAVLVKEGPTLRALRREAGEGAADRVHPRAGARPDHRAPPGVDSGRPA